MLFNFDACQIYRVKSIRFFILSRKFFLVKIISPHFFGGDNFSDGVFIDEMGLPFHIQDDGEIVKTSDEPGHLIPAK